MSKFIGVTMARFGKLFSLVTGLIFLSNLVFAQGMPVSTFNCGQTLPCNKYDSDFPSNSRAAQIADMCIYQKTGRTPGAAIFDATSGFDSDGCLVQSGGGAKCCIQQTGGGACPLRCTLIAQ